MATLTEPELRWARREMAPPKMTMDERLEHAGYVRCPGYGGRGCLALLPLLSPHYLCHFCEGKARRR